MSGVTQTLNFWSLANILTKFGQSCFRQTENLPTVSLVIHSIKVKEDRKPEFTDDVGSQKKIILLKMH